MQAEKKQFQVQLFQGVEHGFALRADLNNAYERTFSCGGCVRLELTLDRIC